MIDLHTHILPNFDDGATTVEESLRRREKNGDVQPQTVIEGKRLERRSPVNKKG